VRTPLLFLLPGPQTASIQLKSGMASEENMPEGSRDEVEMCRRRDACSAAEHWGRSGVHIWGPGGEMQVTVKR
jgi:hypothetical protein